MKKRIIQTKDKDIFNKMNMLNLYPEVKLTKKPNNKILRMLNHINQNEELIGIKDMGNSIVLKKISNCRFNVYLKR